MSGAPSAASADNLVLVEQQGAIVTLRLNRPERLNALNVDLSRALQAALVRVSEENQARAVILTGAGRGFCAGGDLNLLCEVRLRGRAKELEGLLLAGKEIVLTLAAMPIPVIAAVNGPAAGGGMNLALACDMRIASEQASFAESFSKLGLFPDWGGIYLLPRLVGPAKAAELFYTGEMIPASEASRLGLVNRVVPAEKLEEEARIMASHLAEAPPLAVRAIRRALFGDRATLERTLDLENETQRACFLSEDCAEGLEAFMAKRKPHFQGR